MSRHTGVFANVFHPVCSSQISYCLDMLESGKADRIMMVLLSLPDNIAFPVSYSNRWKMLTAACAADDRLIPVQLPESILKNPVQARIVRFLRKQYPKDVFFSFPSGSVPSVVPDDVLKLLTDDSPDLFPSVREYCSVLGLYGSFSHIKDADTRIALLFKALNPHRFAHSLSVAWTAKTMAFRFGVDPFKAEEAGLFHDCAKCLSLSEMQEIARRYSITDDPSFLGSGALLHSVVGAKVARNVYRIDDPEILEAIAYHNTGFPGMSRLAMCVCLADFIEPNRVAFPALEETRRIAETSLENALLLSLECTVRYVRSKGKPLNTRTLDTIAWLKSLPGTLSDCSIDQSRSGGIL